MFWRRPSGAKNAPQNAPPSGGLSLERFLADPTPLAPSPRGAMHFTTGNVEMWPPPNCEAALPPVGGGGGMPGMPGMPTGGAAPVPVSSHMVAQATVFSTAGAGVSSMPTPPAMSQVTVTATSVVEHHAYGGGGGTSGMYGYGGASGPCAAGPAGGCAVAGAAMPPPPSSVPSSSPTSMPPTSLAASPASGESSTGQTGTQVVAWMDVGRKPMTTGRRQSGMPGLPARGPGWLDGGHSPPQSSPSLLVGAGAGALVARCAVHVNVSARTYPDLAYVAFDGNFEALSFQSKSVHQPTPNSSTLRCNNSDVAMPPKRRPAARARAPKRAPKRAAKRRASSSRVDGEELDWEIRERQRYELPGEAWYHRWVPNWPWGRMAFIPKTLRLLSPAAAEPVTRATVAAEGLRMAMSYAGLVFEDRRVSVEEFAELRRANELFCGLPVLMVGTETPPRPDALWRVNAIARYVGRISHNNANLYPEDPVKAAMVDAVLDDVVEMITSELEGATCILDSLELMLRHAKYGWVANTKHPSVADFIVASHTQKLPSLVPGLENLSKYPQMVAHADKVVRLEAYNYHSD
ncbi:Probable glutathione S-transferase 8 (GST class-sigma) [Durusdinium trenchii]|uniref:Probable glutathione S-transferase 8 (GST class-sigma) n=1 Tax=Durusdinium trenchii TaxID=1381693 RepID=A0ABP0N1U0_9DINO